MCRSLHSPLGSTNCRLDDTRRPVLQTVFITGPVSNGNDNYTSANRGTANIGTCAAVVAGWATNLLTKVYITATHHYFTKAICCHSGEFRQFRSSLMKLFQQSERWNLKLPIANAAINIRQHSYCTLCGQTAALISLNTRALQTNSANRALQINYCVTIKNCNCVLQRGTQNESEHNASNSYIAA